ncbi:DUF4199 domain-containing protein [Saccharicrinis sp. FJH62]|uniref:DUF4199 domain-containing protein n=1 Tax=Saccharicrinis sp. FJH62 TaxID=3344657 RepID=UPI0035D52781
MEKDQSIISNSMFYGFIFGIVLVIYNIILTTTGMNKTLISGGFTMSMMSMLLSLILYFGGVFISQQQYRNRKLGGYITYGKAFTFGLLVTVFASLLVAVYSYVYAQWVNPDYGKELYEMSRQLTMDMLDRFNAPAEAVDQALAKLEENGISTPQDFAFGSITNGIIIGTIISLLTSIFVKKVNKDPFAGIEEDITE